MTAKVLQLRPTAHPFAIFVRIGDTGHRLLADLLATGRLPAKSVVVDASRYRHQQELVEAFRAAGAEIVLDTKVAELAAPGKYEGFARGAPWSDCADDKPLGLNFFGPDAKSDVISQIARFAVAHRINAVLAPTYFLADGVDSPWFEKDRHSCHALRAALDREGGSSIAIDYPLINHSRRMERMRATLEDLYETRGRGVPRSPPAIRRATVSAVIRGGGA